VRAFVRSCGCALRVLCYLLFCVARVYVMCVRLRSRPCGR